MYVLFKISISELLLNGGYVDHKLFSGKHGKCFKIAHVNLRSLRSKIAYLNVFIHLNNVDILSIFRTWLNSDIDDCEILIDGYNFCRVDRKSIAYDKGVGLLCYVKNGIVYFKNGIYVGGVHLLMRVPSPRCSCLMSNL